MRRYVRSIASLLLMGFIFNVYPSQASYFQEEEGLSRSSKNIAWIRLRTLGEITAKNILQTFDVFDLWRKCISNHKPLPSQPGKRSHGGIRRIVEWGEDRAGYGIAVSNWLWYINSDPLPEENGDTMLFRGFVKKYNEVVRKELLSAAF